MKTQKLPKGFIGIAEVKGSKFERVKETQYAYMYMVDDSHYEVFEKKTTPICLDFEHRIYSDVEVKEVYPKAKDFGIWAWTKNDYESACNLLDSLKKEDKIKINV
jgi:hypothetical protein